MCYELRSTLRLCDLRSTMMAWEAVQRVTRPYSFGVTLPFPPSHGWRYLNNDHVRTLNYIRGVC